MCVWLIIIFFSSLGICNSQRLDTLLPALNLSCFNTKLLQLVLLFLVGEAVLASEVFFAILSYSTPFSKSRLQAGPHPPWVPSQHHKQQIYLLTFGVVFVFHSDGGRKERDLE